MEFRLGQDYDSISFHRSDDLLPCFLRLKKSRKCLDDYILGIIYPSLAGSPDLFEFVNGIALFATHDFTGNLATSWKGGFIHPNTGLLSVSPAFLRAAELRLARRNWNVLLLFRLRSIRRLFRDRFTIIAIRLRRGGFIF